METKLYKELAQRIQARKTCSEKNSLEWFVKHGEFAEKLLDQLPQGSGLDYTWHIDYDHSSDNRVILTMSYHAMADSGMYDRVIDFTLTIAPSLIFDFDLSIVGNFGKYQDIKDYLYDILRESLGQTIDTEKIAATIS
jgi:hypothetical protein